METQQVLVRPDTGGNEKPRFDIDRGKLFVSYIQYPSELHHLAEIKSTVSPFLFLAVDLPPPPLFQDAVEKNIIPQVSIQSVLAKYDGQKTQVRRGPLSQFRSLLTRCLQESAGQLRRFKCQQLPRYIILHFKRFTKNMFVEEKNPTIVNFPLRGLDFRECKVIRCAHIPATDGVFYVSVDLDAPSSQSSTVYDLIANITHESAAGTTRDKESTVWKVLLRAGAGGGENEKWFQIQDLIVEEIRKEMIVLGETILQVRVSHVCEIPCFPS